jgi:hypothetical protein
MAKSREQLRREMRQANKDARTAAKSGDGAAQRKAAQRQDDLTRQINDAMPAQYRNDPNAFLYRW